MYNNAKKKFIVAKKTTPLIALIQENFPYLDVDELVTVGAVWQDKHRLKNLEQLIEKNQTITFYLSKNQFKRWQLPIKNIVCEDKNIIIVNKPAGISTVPDRSSITNNLTWGVAQYIAKKGSNYSPTAINRLDLMVSGLVLFAKNKKVERELFQNTMKRNIGKLYQVELDPNEKLPRKKRIKDNISFKNKAIVDEEGKPAHSFFIQKTNETYSVILLTGRRHQIRCHAAHYLSPIQGDTYYGSKIRLHNQKIALTSVGLNFFCQKKRYRVRLMKEDH